MGDYPEKTAPEVNTKCIGCRETIHPDATICPHCGSLQKPRKWQSLATFIKWIGGIAAVVSLVVGVVRVNELYEDWRHRAEAVNELAAAAKLQLKQGFYEGAWELNQLALDLKPGSPLGRRQQVIIAKEWLRNIRISGDDTFTAIVDLLLPALSRGAAAAETASEKADFLAHIGWAHYLRRREGRIGTDIDAIFQSALEQDPNNVYAHVMWGFWILWPYNIESYPNDSMTLAKQHFASAHKTGLHREYVTSLQLAALFNRKNNERKTEVVRVVNRIRKNNYQLPEDSKRDVLWLFKDLARERSNTNELLEGYLRVVPVEELIATFQWVSNIESAEPGQSAYYNNKYITARLKEAAGQKKEAREIYLELQQELPSQFTGLDRSLQRAFERLKHLQPKAQKE